MEMAHLARTPISGYGLGDYRERGQSHRNFDLDGTERTADRRETNQDYRKRQRIPSHFQPRGRSEYCNSKEVRRIERNPAVGDIEWISQKWTERRKKDIENSTSVMTRKDETATHNSRKDRWLKGSVGSEWPRGSGRSQRSEGSNRSERQERSERSKRSERSEPSEWSKQRRRCLSRRNQKRISEGRKDYSTSPPRSVCKTAFKQISTFNAQCTQNHDFTVPDESILVNASQNEMEDLASHILCSICEVFDGKTDLKSLNKCISAWLLSFNSTKSLWTFLARFDAFHISRETSHPEAVDDREFEEPYTYDAIIVEGRPNIQLCTTHYSKKRTCDKQCNALHVCKYFILKKCEFTESFRNSCQFGHDLHTDHNKKVMHRSLIHKFPDPKDMLRQMKYRNSSTVPLICNYYNRQSGCRNASCQFLHICKSFIIDECQSNPCSLTHDLKSDQAQELLSRYWITPREKDVLNVLKRIENERMLASGEAYNIVSRKKTIQDTETPEQKSTGFQYTNVKPFDQDPKERIILHSSMVKAATSDPNMKHPVADRTRNTDIASCSNRDHLKERSGGDVNKKTMIQDGLIKYTATKESEQNRETKARVAFALHKDPPKEQVQEQDLPENTTKSSGSSQYPLKDPTKGKTFEDPRRKLLKSSSPTKDTKKQPNIDQKRNRGLNKHLPKEESFEKPARKIKRSSVLTNPPPREVSVVDPSIISMMSSEQTSEASEKREDFKTTYDISPDPTKQPSTGTHNTDPSRKAKIFVVSSKASANEQLAESSEEKTLTSPGPNKDSQKEQSAIDPAKDTRLSFSSNEYQAQKKPVVGPAKKIMMSHWSDEGLEKNISMSCASDKHSQKEEPSIHADKKILMPSGFDKAVEPSKKSKIQSTNKSTKERTIKDPAKNTFKSSGAKSGTKKQPFMDCSREIVTSFSQEQTVEDPPEKTFRLSVSQNVLKKQPFVYPASEKVISSSVSKDTQKEQTVEVSDEKQIMKSGSSEDPTKGKTVGDPGVKKMKSSVSNKGRKQQPNVIRQRKRLIPYDANEDLPKEQSIARPARKRKTSSVCNDVPPEEISVVDPSMLSLLPSDHNGDPQEKLFLDLKRMNDISSDPNKHPSKGTHFKDPIKKAPAKQQPGLGLNKSLGNEESFVIPAKKRMLSNSMNTDAAKIESEVDLDISTQSTTPDKYALKEQPLVHADKRSLMSTCFNKDSLKPQQAVGPSKKSKTQSGSCKNSPKTQAIGDSAEKMFMSSGSKNGTKKQPLVYPASEKVPLSSPSKNTHKEKRVKGPAEKTLTKYSLNKNPIDITLADDPGMKTVKSSSSAKGTKLQPNVDRLISNNETKDIPKEQSIARPSRKRKISSVFKDVPPDEITVVDPSVIPELSSHHTWDPPEKLFVNAKSKNKPDRNKGTHVTDPSKESMLSSGSNKAPAKEQHTRVSVEKTTILRSKDANKTKPAINPTTETRMSFALDGNLGKDESDVVPTKKRLAHGWNKGPTKVVSDVFFLNKSPLKEQPLYLHADQKLEIPSGNNKDSPRGQTAVGSSKKSKMQSGSKKHPQKEKIFEDPAEITLRAYADDSVTKRKPFVIPAREILKVQVEGTAKKTLMKSGSNKGTKVPNENPKLKRIDTSNANNDTPKEEQYWNPARKRLIPKIPPGTQTPVTSDLNDSPSKQHKSFKSTPSIRDHLKEQPLDDHSRKALSSQNQDHHEELKGVVSVRSTKISSAHKRDLQEEQQLVSSKEESCFVNRDPSKVPSVDDSGREMMTQSVVSRDTSDVKEYVGVGEDLDATDITDWQWEWMADEGDWTTVEDCTYLEYGFRWYLRTQKMKIWLKNKPGEINFSTMDGKIFGDSPLVFKRVKPSLAEEDGGWIPIKDCSLLEVNFLEYLKAERMEIFINKRRSEINFSTMKGRILGESPLQFRRVKKEQTVKDKE